MNPSPLDRHGQDFLLPLPVSGRGLGGGVWRTAPSAANPSPPTPLPETGRGERILASRETLNQRVVVAIVVSVGLLAVIVATGGRDGHAQDAKEAKSTPAVASQRILNCQRCHTAPLPGDEAAGITSFVTLTEFKVWHEQDLHATAYENIVPNQTGGPGGRPNQAWEMEQRLKPHRPAGYKVNAAAECLTCHAVDLTMHRQPAVPLADKKLSDFDTLSGVSCEACHGLADNWESPHARPKWRQVMPEEKEKAGQVDLRDPQKRTLKCASCHIGNTEEGKFITHEMYAAGHPALPPFEMVTFCRDEPRHWFTHRENKVLAAMDETQARTNFHFAAPATATKTSGVCPDARDLVIGAVAAFEANMKLLAEDATATEKSGGLLDFAHFDCYACHHDLRVPSDRQPRGVPGRPLPRQWDLLQGVLTNLGGADNAKLADPVKNTQTGLGDLRKAFEDRPFGNPKDVAARASDLQKLCRDIRPELAKVSFTSDRTRDLYRKLADRIAAKDATYLDHDSAQQLVWALAVLQEELRASGGSAETEAAKTARQKLNAIVALELATKPRSPIGPRAGARQAEIQRFEFKPFRDAAHNWVKALEPK